MWVSLCGILYKLLLIHILSSSEWIVTYFFFSSISVCSFFLVLTSLFNKDFLDVRCVQWLHLWTRFGSIIAINKNPINQPHIDGRNVGEKEICHLVAIEEKQLVFRVSFGAFWCLFCPMWGYNLFDRLLTWNKHTTIRCQPPICMCFVSFYDHMRSHTHTRHIRMTLSDVGLQFSWIPTFGIVSFFMRPIFFLFIIAVAFVFWLNSLKFLLEIVSACCCCFFPFSMICHRPHQSGQL